ncbi:MAG: hypothetical protein JWQ49_4212 [Edaphobacter sp.]|nr:hypothetical protein [Edaphobacter sp.]
MFHDVSFRGCVRLRFSRMNLHSIFLAFGPNPVHVLAVSVLVEGDVGMGMRPRRMRGVMSTNAECTPSLLSICNMFVSMSGW